MATPANSSYNERVIEAARESILSGGKTVSDTLNVPEVTHGNHTSRAGAWSPAGSRLPAAAPQRYLALDAYRGFIMLILVSGGFGLAALAKNRPAFAGIAGQFDHKPWEWIAFWDLIQPAFMFMVGVAMPFALASREAQGATDSQLFWHVAARSLRLILMSQILMSISAGTPALPAHQCAGADRLTYFLCYLIMQLEFRWQAVIAAA